MRLVDETDIDLVRVRDTVGDVLRDTEIVKLVEGVMERVKGCVVGIAVFEVVIEVVAVAKGDAATVERPETDLVRDKVIV